VKGVFFFGGRNTFSVLARMQEGNPLFESGMDREQIQDC